MVPIDRLKDLIETWNERDNERTRMGFDWIYMNAIDDLADLIEEYEAKNIENES